MTEKNDALVRAAFPAFLEKAFVKEVAPVLRDEALACCEPGETGTIKSPLDGSKLGRYTVTDPDWNGHVTNRSAVDRWVRERYREKTQTKKRIVNQAEAIAILEEIRPDLVEEYVYVPDHVAESLVRRSEQAHEPCGWGGEVGEQAPPGIEVLPPKPGLRITLDKNNAVPGFRALWNAGQFTGAMLEIEGER